MKTNNRICGLITDFGNKDYFIGVLKGVMKSINPAIEVIDISNDIPSYSLLPASFTIDKTFRYFPSASVFLVVVDPGVGTGRNLLLVEYEGRFFIAPDNGVLTPILQEAGKAAVLDNKKYFIIDGHSTFEARDKMAPAAAYLTAGVAPDEIASPTSEFVINPEYFPSKTATSIKALIVYIDKFGNIMTNVTQEFLFNTLKESGLSRFKAEFNGSQIKGFHRTYAYGGSKPFMLIGSHRNLEIAKNQNSAAAALDAGIGQPVTIHFY